MPSSTATFEARQDRPRINPDLQDVANRLHQEFDGRLDPRVVDECTIRIALQFDAAKVRSFVPLLVRRYASAELGKLLEAT